MHTYITVCIIFDFYQTEPMKCFHWTCGLCCLLCIKVLIYAQKHTCGIKLAYKIYYVGFIVYY